MISLRSLRFGRFRRDSRGAAAVEFALVAPMMLTMYFGMVEVSTGVAIDRKVTLVSHTASDLVAQATTISDSDMTNVFNASSAVLTPYAVTPLTVKVTAVSIDNTGKATVAWSNFWTTAGMTSGYTAGSVVTSSVPPGLIVNNTQLIWAEVSYVYTPIIGYVVKSAVTLSDKFFARPRQSTTVSRTS